MKQVNHSVEIQHKEGSELSKKLYRTVSDTAKKLDDARSCIRNICDLFIAPHLILRRKFCDYCERLIFSDPTLYGRKSEELLWRKSFYEPVSSAKQLKKIADFTEIEILKLTNHINSGIGFYNHLITKLQYEYKIDLKNAVDFSVDIDKEATGADVTLELIKWAEQSVHQCLIYIGDLYRYKSEIQPTADANFAERHYLQAVSYKPQYGMPHNQMGTLAMSHNKYLDAVYHYLRCLTCKFPFEGTSNNLQNLFDRNAQIAAKIPTNDNDQSDPTTESLEHLLVRFLSLIDILYYDKKETNDRVYDLCNEISLSFGKCLKCSKNDLLTSEMVFKMIVICLITISKLQSINSKQLPPLVAFTLSTYLQIVKMVADNIQEFILNHPLPESSKSTTGILNELMCNGSKKIKTKLRRRKVQIDSEDESDVSDSDKSDNNADYSSSDDSFSSDEENNLSGDSSEDDDDDEDGDGDDTAKDLLKKSGKNGSKDKLHNNLEMAYKKIQKIDIKDILDVISGNGLFQSIKILVDWLRTDEDLIKQCLFNNPILITETLRLFNLLNINITTTKAFMANFKITKLIADEHLIPISEDIILKGTQLYKKNITTSNFDWNYTFSKQINMREEAVIRIIKFIAFAKYLTKIPTISVSFDKNNNIFICNLVNSNNIDEKTNNDEMNQNPIISKIIRESKVPSVKNGTNMTKMKHMGQLWLASEVQALENKFGGNASRATLSPYLVLDADALIKYISMVKHLVHSRKFIVLIPEAVLSALDNLKKDKIEAREAIRWLELQFKKGNRFFRAQRPNEKTTIPRIKYPKKKNREMQLYIQIIECCNFFAQQQKDATNVVTLLIGNNQILSSNDSKELSYVGLAETIGIVIDSIPSFYEKWKRSKGKR